MSKKTVLLTGGLGYIGSHTAVEMIKSGYDVVILDNLSNAKESVANRIEKITGVMPKTYIGNAEDRNLLKKIHGETSFNSVVHFAGYKAVGESVKEPLKYYENNIDTTLSLLFVMKEVGVNNIIFSSSATVYGDMSEPPFTEKSPVGNCTNPYGWTKYMNEVILKDASKADENLGVILLRYFNPIGAHESGLIGEEPQGIPNNLMPYIQQVASGIRDHLSVYGNDYDTPDGTGVRDYIHVVDLARGHVKALDYLMKENSRGVLTVNLGTGQGTSVLEAINAFEKANGVKIPYEIAPRRAGDIASCYADCKKAKDVLGWKAELTFEDAARDAWNWEKNRTKEMNK